MSTVPLLSSSAALVLIDFQKAVDHPSWGRRNNPQAEENAARLLERWRNTARPVVHVRHVSREPLSTFRGGGLAFKELTAPRGEEPVFTKHRPGALTGTALEAWLRERHIEHLVITGVSTNNSVEATARVAGDLGFVTIVVSDATFTFDRNDFEGRFRSAEEVHAMSLANLSSEYATVCTTDEVLRATQAPITGAVKR